MKRLQVFVVAVSVVCLSGSVLGQGPTPGSVTPRRDTAKPATTGAGKIRGRVVAATANTPLRRAQMVLYTENGQRTLVIVNSR